MSDKTDAQRQDQAVWLDAVERTSAGLKGAARSSRRSLGAGDAGCAEDTRPRCRSPSMTFHSR